jgi:hypothetical protein
MHESFCANLRREVYALLEVTRNTIGQCDVDRAQEPETSLRITRTESRLTTLVLDCVAEAMALSESTVVPEGSPLTDETLFPSASGSLDTVAPQLEKLMVDAEALHARLRRLRTGMHDSVGATRAANGSAGEVVAGLPLAPERP